MGKIRLIKIASEINIGKDTIVDFLREKGFDIENKPTTSLSEEMQAAVYEKFKREKTSALDWRKKLSDQKEKSEATPKVVSFGQDSESLAAENASEEVPEEVVVPEVKKEKIKPEKQESAATLFDTKDVEAPPAESPGAKNAEKKSIPAKKEAEKATEVKKTSTRTAAKNAKTKKIETENKPAKKRENSAKKEDKDKTKRKRKTDRHLTSRLGDMMTTPIVLDATDATEFAAKLKAKEEKKLEKEKIIAAEKELLEKERQRELADKARLAAIEEQRKAIEKEKEKNRQEKIAKLGEKTDLKGLTVLGKIELTKPVPPPVKLSRREREREERKKRDAERKEARANGWKPYSSDRDKTSDTRKFARDNRNDEKRENRNKEEHSFKSGKEFRENRGNKENREKIQIRSGERRFVSRNGTAKSKTLAGENKDRNSQRIAQAKTTFADFIKPANSGTTVKRIFTNSPAVSQNASKVKFADKRKKKNLRSIVSDEDVNRKIRETLSGMDDNYSSVKKAKIRQQKKASREEKETLLQEISEREARTLSLAEFVTTSDLAKLMNISANEIILKCMQLGLMVTINQRLDKDTLLLIASDYGFEVEFGEADEMIDIEESEDAAEDLLPRPPIVTIMGHVDHGKTSLLDHIRNANVVAGESGGITQHIGAYRVTLKNGKHITFLDTPGHEAFTAMRARGAQVTDIVVLVVAADDSVMPQTIEAISHARAANVPIIVAINKVDKAEANVDRIKQQLADQGILVEDWGGKNQCAEISAKKGTNVNVLLDKILLEAEMLDLKANPNRNASGVVIESKMDMKLGGKVATIVVQRGTLVLGESFVAGANFGKTRALLDERGHKVKDVLPSQPVMVVGFDGLPEAGDTFHVIDSETKAREIANTRRQLRREQDMRKVRHVTLDDISAQISIGGVKDLILLIKGDVAGSVEALSDSLLKLSTEEVRVRILHKGAGAVTESDVMLAAASNAIIIAFNVSATAEVVRLAANEKIELRNYNIIYDCINEIHLALEGMLKPEIKEETLATVEVRKIFKFGRSAQIAGCYVLSGKVSRNDKVRILRNGLLQHSCSLTSLKRNKDDVKEVDQNYECGIQLDGWNNFEEGDIIEAYKLVEVKRVLQ